MIYIQRLKIKNFRSIKNQEIDFRKDINILVGANDAGKSNIFEAINLLFGDVYLPRFKPAITDFYNGIDDQEIIVEATLSFDESDIGQFQEFPIENGTLRIRYVYNRKDGARFEAYTNRGWSSKQYSTGYTIPFGYYFDLEKKLEFIYVRSARNIIEHTPTRWQSPFRKIREIIDEEIETDKDVLALAKEVEKINERLTGTKALKEFRESLEKVARTQTGFNSVSFGIAPYTKTDFLKNLQIYIDDGFKSIAETKGTGSQNSIIISLFRVLAKKIREKESKNIIYAFEEPEIALHPHGQRQLFKSLKELSNYSQIFVSTHSPAIVSLEKYKSTFLVRKINNETKVFCVEDLGFDAEEDTREAFKFLKEFDQERNELFFSNKVLLVEGDSDKIAFQTILRQSGIDLDLNKISVIDAGGKDKIIVIAKVLQGFKIPSVIVYDIDYREIPEGVDTTQGYWKIQKEKNNQALRLNPIIDSFRDDLIKIFPLDADFEEVAGLPSSGDSATKLMRAYNYAKTTEFNQLPEIFKNIISEFRS